MRIPTLKVLSVDFDYFQKVPLDVMMNCYPDGLDLGSALTEVTWATHYGYSWDELMSIQTDSDKLTQLRKIIEKQDIETHVYIANSHVHIYDIIMGYLYSKPDCFNGCDIWNIDMHHDYFNHDRELDCGNWVWYIQQDITPSKVVWIARDISEKAFGKVDLETKYDFKTIQNRQFDMIFICRSDSWLPPHLDVNFNNLVKFMRKNFENILIEEQVKTPRNMQAILKVAKQQQDYIKEMKKYMK